MLKIPEIIEIIKEAFRSILSNKLRSILASLGVVIGVSFVILMGWFLSGLDRAVEETFNLIGVDMIYVDQWDWAGGRNWKLLAARKPITLNQAEELAKVLETAEIVVPVARKWNSSIVYKNDKLSGISVIGTKSEYGQTPGGTVVEGRFFSVFEESQSSNVVVLGYGVNKTLFPKNDGIGQIIKINGKKFQIIGIVKKQSTILMDFLDNQLYIPLNTFVGLFGNYRRSVSIAVKAGSENNLDLVRAETIGAMRVIRNLKPWQEDDFSINETKAFEKSVESLRLYVWGIGIGLTVLSFIVGLIGIMNIMFVSVVERTKEIGIRKALGARRVTILTQFLSESSFLCLVGAVFSIIFCSVLIYFVATFLPKVIPSTEFLLPYLPIRLIIIASVVSVFVGILAGLLPALRASKLDPVESLRFE